MQNHEQEERFRFPDEKPTEELEIEIEGETEIEVVDDTPEADRGRKPMKEPPAEVTDEELSQYSEGVKKRIQHFSKGYHEERRAKEVALREREEALRAAVVLADENRRLKTAEKQKLVDTDLAEAKRKLQQAYETGDSKLLIVAQDALAGAKIEEDKLLEIAKALKVSLDTIKNFSEELAINYFNNFYDNSSSQGNSFNQGTFATFNPLDKLLEAHEENKKLYERLLQAEQEKIAYLEKLMNKK